MGSKTSETKHFLKTCPCCLTSTYLLPKKYKETISHQCRQPSLPSRPKVQGKEGNTNPRFFPGIVAPEGLSALTSCFAAAILITLLCSFFEELTLYMVPFHIPETNDHHIGVMVRSQGSQKHLHDQTLAHAEVLKLINSVLLPLPPQLVKT